MSKKSQVAGGEQKRRDRAEETDRTAKALIAAERAAADRKTERLREARLAQEAGEGELQAEPKPKPRAKAKPKPGLKPKAPPAGKRKG